MYDVLIIGAGPVGLCAALSTALQGLHTVVLESKAGGGVRSLRVFALSQGARLILERLGVWAQLGQPVPIRAVHVSQRGRFGHTLLRADELGLGALGYVVAESALLQVLRQRLESLHIECIRGAQVLSIESDRHAARVCYEQEGMSGTLCAHIAAQADGGMHAPEEDGATRLDYRQCALTAEVECEGARRDWAYERFTGKGPIALLPFGARHALIWSVPSGEAQALCALSEESFAQALQSAYGERIGAVAVHGPLASFPLQLRYAHRIAGERHVLIGNAAQTLHPVAGQGFNLGLRDAFELARAAADARRRGEDMLHGLHTYRTRRRVDRAGGTLFTDFLVRMFSNDDPVLAAARSTGLFLLDAAGPAKRFLMRRMIFGSRA